MRKTIHVPQGRSARLMHPATLSLDIEGLFTYGFSTCNIIVAISEERIVLIHVDFQTSIKEIKKEIELLSEPNEIILIFREQWQKYLTNQILRQLSEELSNKKQIKLFKIEDEYDGIYVSFNKSTDNTIHPNIKKYRSSQFPENLLRHPQEQQFLSTQKIEQLIGIRAQIETGLKKIKYINIFDGRAWEPVSEDELYVDTNNPITKNEMNFLSCEDDYLTLTLKLREFVRLLEGKVSQIVELKDLVMPIGIHLEGYLNNFNALKLLKRDLLVLLDDKSKKNIFHLETPSSDEDQKIIVQLNEILNIDPNNNSTTNTDSNDNSNTNTNPNTSADAIYTLFSTYKTTAPETDFKNQLVSEIETFYRHYNYRMLYHTQAEEYKIMQNQASEFCKNAIPLYQSREYSGSTYLFFEALKFSTYSYLKTQKELAIVYYNLGRSNFQQGQYQEAEFFISAALNFHKDYLKSPQSEITKVESALQLCKEKLDETSKIENENRITPS